MGVTLEGIKYCVPRIPKKEGIDVKELDYLMGNPLQSTKERIDDATEKFKEMCPETYKGYRQGYNLPRLNEAAQRPSPPKTRREQ
jgi:hypothetical protein